MEQRLQKLLAAAGVASRRESEKLITSGRISVDGKVVSELGVKVDPEKSVIAVDGKPVSLNPERVYVLLNKPRGYTSTRKDPHALRVVTDLVKDIDIPLYPVGRLDVDSEGLLILTNDGDFSFKLTHPRHHIPKTYRVEVRGLITQEIINHLSKGIVLDDGQTAPADASLVAINTARQTSVVDIVLTEGRKRQVRRMFETIGFPVARLTRTKIGSITIGKLKPGEWRFLAQQEVQNLLSSAT